MPLKSLKFDNYRKIDNDAAFSLGAVKTPFTVVLSDIPDRDEIRNLERLGYLQSASIRTFRSPDDEELKELNRFGKWLDYIFVGPQPYPLESEDLGGLKKLDFSGLLTFEGQYYPEARQVEVLNGWGRPVVMKILFKNHNATFERLHHPETH